MNSNLGWNTEKDWTVFEAWHNKETRDGSFNRPSCMTSHINKLTQDYELEKSTKSISLKPRRIVSHIKWEAPLMDWIKLNIDEVRDKNDNSSYGDIIRGSDGE